MFAQLVQFVGGQREPAENQTGKQNGGEYRKDASDTTDIKLSETELLSFQIIQNDAGNQIAGNHEKNIDADKSAFEMFWEGVENEYAKYGDGSQTVDIRTVSHVL